MKSIKKSRIISLLIVCVLLSSMLFGCSGKTDEAPATADPNPAQTETPDTGETSEPVDDTVYELKFSHHDPANGTKGLMFQAWADKIYEDSNGRVKITIFAGSTLGAPTDGLNMVETGITDILWSFTGFFNKEFPATDVISLPMIGFRNAEDTVDVYWDLYESRPEIQKEFEGLKVLTLYAHPPAALGTNKLVETVADMKNVKVRVPTGPATDVITTWGAAPVTIPTPEIYQSLEKNVIEGFTFDWSGIKAFKLNEPIDYFLDFNLYAGPMFIVINEDKWNELPADLQDIIWANSGREFSHYFCQQEDATVTEFIAEIQTAGKTVTTPTDEAMAEFKAGADSVITAWIKSMGDQGYDGQGLYDDTIALIDKYVK